MRKIRFSEEDIKKCQEFADKSDLSLYKKRNGSSDDKRKKDTVIGKLGEIATFKYLKNEYPDLSKPDFNIYQKKDKSWDFDLKCDDINIHVKSQDVAQGQKYGISWIFQYGNGLNRGYDKEVFDHNTPNQFISFVSIDLIKSMAVIQGFMDLGFIHEKDLWKMPKLEHLQKANKLAIYLKDLEFYPKELFAL